MGAATTTNVQVGRLLSHSICVRCGCLEPPIVRSIMICRADMSIVPLVLPFLAQKIRTYPSPIIHLPTATSAIGVARKVCMVLIHDDDVAD